MLNPWRVLGTPTGWPDFKKVRLGTRFGGMAGPYAEYDMWLSRMMGLGIAQVCGSRGVDIVWATTWWAEADVIANHVGLPRGLPSFGPEAIEGESMFVSCGKRPGVIADAGDEPLAWIDDDFGDADRLWARDRRRSGLRTLLIKPMANVGLLPGHLRILDRWASEISPAET